ncbi:MAG: N-acetylmuramoyl-L-alanine amidase, partial [Priestia megaterium]
ATGTETYYNETSNYDGTTNPYPAQSKKLAQAVHQNFQPVLGLSNRGVQNANFYVNRRAKMPSILIEVGFVSSPFDLSRIKNTTIRQNATAGIAKGINEYFTN